jgi:aspartyl-tRNA synthetase
MERTEISKVKDFIGKKVLIKSWVDTIRDQKTMQFLILKDRTGLVQAINEKSKNKEIEKNISNLTIDSVVKIEGLVKENSQVKMGGIEIQIEKLEILSLAEASLPIDFESSQENRMDWRFLDLRNNKKRLIFEIQTELENAMREFWIKNGFIEMNSPKLMSSASESGSELFKVAYFGGSAYLSQSPQFYKQMAMASGFEKVFEIGPVFRANPSFTSRHDTEFTSIDVEISWIDSHDDVMKFEEEWLTFAITKVKEKFGSKIKEAFGVEINIPKLPFPRIKLSDALKIVEKMGHKIADQDLDPEGEKLIYKYVKEKLNHEFVFIIDYPISVRPFYHMRHEKDKNLTKSFDLLWKGLEITTGAQREHRYDILKKQALEKGLSEKNIGYYLDFFKYGCPPHGGFGMGLTRVLMTLMEFKNVREVTYLYRGPNRLSP